MWCVPLKLKVLRQSTCIFAAAIKNQITRVSYRITSTITKRLLLFSELLSQKSIPPPARGRWLPTSDSLHQQPVSSLLSRLWQPCRISLNSRATGVRGPAFARAQEDGCRVCCSDEPEQRVDQVNPDGTLHANDTALLGRSLGVDEDLAENAEECEPENAVATVSVYCCS